MTSTETPPTPEQVAAYDAGRKAYADGEPSTACPHADDSGGGLRTLWVRGYVFARKDDLAGRPAAGVD